MIHLNIATGINLPPFWLNRPVHVLEPARIDGADPNEYLGNLYQSPLRIKWQEESEWWTLPLDPVISVAGKNIIVRRNVLKQGENDNTRRGSVKEAWGQDDYEINIAGSFIGTDAVPIPEHDLRRFRRYCEARKLIEVECDLFTIFKISRLAIETYDLPFTKGIENQMWAIKAYSDDTFSLLVEEKRG